MVEKFDAAGVGQYYRDLIDLGVGELPDFEDQPFMVDFWIESLKGVPSVSVDLARSTVANEAVISNGWVDLTTWETSIMTRAEAKALRCEFVSNCVLKSCSSSYIVDCQERWSKGQFTSVSESHVVIGDVWATLPHPLKRRAERDSFVSAPGQLEEVDIPAPYAEVGRQNLTMTQYRTMQWGTDFNDFYAIRPKINGERLVSTVVEGKRKLVGFRSIEVPKDFAPEVLEYYGGKFYVIYPYGIPSFEYSGMQFRAHPWMSVQEYRERSRTLSGHKYDGLMLATQKGEYRVKKMPTMEFLDPPGRVGVWECTWGYSWNTTVPKLVAIRPRPGKAVAKNVDRLHSLLTLKALIPLLPEASPDVRVIESGYYKSPIAFRGRSQEQVYIDSGCRYCQEKGYWTRTARIPVVKTPEGELKYDPTTTSHGHYTYRDQAGSPISYPAPPYSKKDVQVAFLTGAKCFAICPKTKRLLFVREKDKKIGGLKPYDCLGGVIEPGETPLVAMLREIKEEADVVVDPQKLVSLGYTDDIGFEGQRKTFYRSHVYMILWYDKIPAHSQWKTLEEMKSMDVDEDSEYQPWGGRHVTFFLSKFATVAEAESYCLLGGVSLGTLEKHHRVLQLSHPRLTRPQRDLLGFLILYIGDTMSPSSSSSKGVSYYKITDELKARNYLFAPSDLTQFPSLLHQGKGCIGLTGAGWAQYWKLRQAS
jgi:ADP-ribose pyrophosphatase YjhB (NUDIX family)